MSSIPASRHPLKVLHVGNIANNAYNNAKVQRQRGIEADVLCFDYYHIMGCPEWEDADFSGEIADPFYPDWWNCNLNGFKRPRWFVQGPLDKSFDYLFALNQNNNNLANRKWKRLEQARKTVCRGKSQLSLAPGKRTLKSFARLFYRFQVISHSTLKSFARLFYSFQVISHSTLKSFARLFYLFLVEKRGSGFIDYETKKRIRGQLSRLPFKSGPLVEKLLVYVHKVLIFLLVRLPLAIIELIRYRLFYRSESKIYRSEPKIYKEQVNNLVNDFKKYFPEREDKLTADVLETWKMQLSNWEKLFKQYDIVQTYATYPIIPLLCEFKNFTAYEHGTIREIPFEENSQGRVCALGYKLAPVVFITNSDNLNAADRLGLTDEQVYCLPHAFDNEKLIRFANESDCSPPDDIVTFFSPSRQHWKDRDPSMAKGNDYIFLAIKALKDAGFVFIVELVEWGRDVEDSKKYIRELGIESFISWIPPMKKRQLWQKYLSVHAVIDQLMLPALGGVGFETMTLGRRLLTAMDMVQGERFFGEAPPLYDVRDDKMLQEAMTAVLNDPEDTQKLGDQARDWIIDYHSADRVCEIQLEAYNKLLDKNLEKVA